MDEWQRSIIKMEEHLQDIRGILRAEIRHKNTLIYILMGIAFGTTAIGASGGL